MHRRQFIAGLMLATSPLAITRTVAQPAPAPGMIPATTYLAMASKGSTLLEETARDAFEKSRDPRVHSFSRAEVVEQVNLSGKLEANAPVAMAMGAPGAPGVVGGLVAAPFAVAGAAVGTAGAVVGGVLGGPGGMPMTSDAQKAEMIARIKSTAPGPAYDAAFVNVQLMAHQEAFAVHDGYARNGDDPALRRVARGALPLIRQHIARLTRMQAEMGRVG